MATLRELKGRISSVGSTEKITGAMKMISSAKLHKAQAALQRLVPYREQIQTILLHLLSTDAEVSSELTQEREVKHITAIVMGSDDGLCGAFNIQILKHLMQSITQWRDSYGRDVAITLRPVGRKMIAATTKLAGDGITVEPATINTRSDIEAIRQFTAGIVESFEKGATDLVAAVYTRFYSTSRQRPLTAALLPVKVDSIVEGSDKLAANRPYLFEPDAGTIFRTVLPQFVLSSMQEIHGQASASEQAARVMAMQSANDNAKDLLDELQLEYNKLRQQGITTELLDILGGQKRE